MRILCLAFIPLLSAFLGFTLSIKYGESKEFWDKFGFWHKKIKAEIAFSQNPLAEIFDSSNKNDGFLIAVKEYLAEKRIKTEFKFLSEDELSFLNKYLQNLGTLDKVSQLNYLNSIEPELTSFSDAAFAKYKKMRPLFVKLGFLLGLIIFILSV